MANTMKRIKGTAVACMAVAVVLAVSAWGQSTGSKGMAHPCTQNPVPMSDTSVIGANGAAHITRVIPLPEDMSPQARAWLSTKVSDARPPAQTIAEQRRASNAWQARAGAEALKLYPAHLAKSVIAGVPVRIVTPLSIPETKKDRVLVEIHGGGFEVDSGSLTETIPIANLTQTKVVAVLYRMAPEHPFPAAVDDVVAVYKALLKTHSPHNMAIYGTSAGAILTAEVAVKLRQLGLPLPAALGVFSGLGNFSVTGDSATMYSFGGLSGYWTPSFLRKLNAHYVGKTNPRNPVLSPVFANVHGFPPTLFLSSTRDTLLSGTTTLQRHFYESGVTSPMVIFEGLPHAFWGNFKLPESHEALEIQAKFFDKYVGAPTSKQ